MHAGIIVINMGCLVEKRSKNIRVRERKMAGILGSLLGMGGRRRRTSRRRRNTRKFNPLKRIHPGIKRMEKLVGSRGSVYGGITTDALARGYLNPRAAFPPMLGFVDLVYGDQKGLTAANATGAYGSEHLFRLNSLFDPDQTNIGHQPIGYDQITPIYGSYKVYAVSGTIEFRDPQTTTMYYGIAIQSHNDTFSFPGNTMTRTMEIPGIQAGWLQSSTGGAVTRATFQIKLWELEGLTFLQYDGEENFGAAVGSNPSLVAALRIAVGDAAAPATGLSVYYTIKLVFHCKFFGRITPGQS